MFYLHYKKIGKFDIFVWTTLAHGKLEIYSCDAWTVCYNPVYHVQQYVLFVSLPRMPYVGSKEIVPRAMAYLFTSKCM